MIDHLTYQRGRTQGPASTARLVIRSFAEADLAAFQAYRLRPEVYRYLFRPLPTPPRRRGSAKSVVNAPCQATQSIDGVVGSY